MHQYAKVIPADAKFGADIVFFHFLKEHAANQVALARGQRFHGFPYSFVDFFGDRSLL